MQPSALSLSSYHQPPAASAVSQRERIRAYLFANADAARDRPAKATPPLGDKGGETGWTSPKRCSHSDVTLYILYR
jgi:hypothetical protein